MPSRSLFRPFFAKCGFTCKVMRRVMTGITAPGYVIHIVYNASAIYIGINES